MQDFLILISRDEFIRLYRFGNIFISKAWVTVDDELAEKQLDNMLNIILIDDEREYLLLNIRDSYSNFCGNTTDSISIIYNVDISKIKQTMVFSQRAYDFYKTKVNTKVNYEILPLKYKKIFSKIKNNYTYNDMQKGASAALEIFGCCSEFNLDKIVDGYINVFEDSFHPSLDKELYFDLLLYKREDKFPINEKSFLYDVAILSLLRIKHKDEKYFGFYKEGSLSIKMLNVMKENTLKVIKEFKSESFFELILELDVSTNEKLEIFKNSLVENSIKKYIVCAIFFKLIDEKNNEKNILDIKIIEQLRPQYQQEVDIAVYLFGIKYGYANLYDELYESKELSLFNSESIIRKEEVDSDKLKNKIQELESQLKKYELQKEPLTGVEIAEEIIIQNNDENLQQTAISENDATIDSKEEVEPIRSFLNCLGHDALIDIWSSAGSENKKDLQSETEENLIENIIINESSCSGVKELLQTFHKDTLASVLYKLYKMSKTKGILQKELKTIDKEQLIVKLLTEYKSHSRNIISQEM